MRGNHGRGSRPMGNRYGPTMPKEIYTSNVGNHINISRYDSISTILSVPKSTVQSIIIRWKTSGTTNNKPRSGRPSLLSPRALRRLKATVRTNRWKTLSHITTEFNRSTVTNPVCSKTIRRRLMDLGFTQHIPKKKPLISEKNRVNRLKFYKLHGSWSIEQWNKVIWSDESRFRLFYSDARQKVWRQTNERYLPECLRKSIQGDGGSIMLWSCFIGNVLGPCYVNNERMNSSSYIQNILSKFYSSFYLQILENCTSPIFQQDNAPCEPHKLTNGFNRKMYQ